MKNNTTVNKTLKVFHVQPWSANYSNWMNNVELVDRMKDADLVLFAGGEDVSPSIYGASKHHTTFTNKDRDAEETKAYNLALELSKPMIGICRGSQLLTALQEGGMLVQDQPNPSNMHDIHTYDGKKLRISSTHHQAMYPFNMKEGSYKIIGWTENLLKYHKDGDDKELNPPKECEIVYYPKNRCLGIQGHPVK